MHGWVHEHSGMFSTTQPFVPHTPPTSQTRTSMVQVVPFSTSWTQPTPGSQLSAVQSSSSSQFVGEPGVQLPLWQVSLLVQGFASSQLVPVAGLWWQVPSPQTSVVQGLPSSQFMSPPWQVPSKHWSLWVQALPSSQGAALGT